MVVKCSGCGEESPNWHTVEAQSSQEGKGGKGTFNFLYKCKFCNRENTLNIISSSLQKINSDECMDFKPLVTFDCRGLQPIDFTPARGWIAEAAESGKHFEDIDLTEKEWVDYDERSQQSVGIYEFESKFIHSK
uniref:CXXC motif containing zinc binding protein n=1 Tax=Graphocephala atropunctata TaxID=36148 RepID=A0A1B6MGG8_9HEMI